MRCPWQKRNKTKPQWHVLHINEAISPGESDILAELKTVKEELTKLRDLIVKEKAQ